MPSDAIWAWSIIVVATAGVIIRPFRLPEAVWAVIGASALVLSGLLPWQDALAGIAKGLDVYLFLIGMMLIAELARLEGLFDYLAALAVEYAAGSPQRLFLLIYLVGTLVTVLLSNDATAIVLTPAVSAATRAAGAKPLPYLFVCAFIANAASFVLPISNPANLVVFGARMPHLTEWLRLFALPSAASILLTYIVLRLTQHRALKEETIAHRVPHPKLGRGGKLTAIGIVAIGIVLVTASALDKQLGLPTFICGGVTELIAKGWETLVEAGYQPEVAYFECLHELKLIVDLMYEGGIAKQRWSVSDTAEYGDYVSGPLVIDQRVKDNMRSVLDKIQDGSFAQRFIDDQDAGGPEFKALRAKGEQHPIEAAGRELRKLMAWVKSHDSDYVEGSSARR